MNYAATNLHIYIMASSLTNIIFSVVHVNVMFLWSWCFVPCWSSSCLIVIRTCRTSSFAISKVWQPCPVSSKDKHVRMLWPSAVPHVLHLQFFFVPPFALSFIILYSPTLIVLPFGFDLSGLSMLISSTLKISLFITHIEYHYIVIQKYWTIASAIIIIFYLYTSFWYLAQ